MIVSATARKKVELYVPDFGPRENWKLKTAFADTKGIYVSRFDSELSTDLETGERKLTIQAEYIFEFAKGDDE